MLYCIHFIISRTSGTFRKIIIYQAFRDCLSINDRETSELLGSIFVNILIDNSKFA